MKRRFAIASLPLILISGALVASAAEIKVLSAVPLAPAMEQLAETAAAKKVLATTGVD